MHGDGGGDKVDFDFTRELTKVMRVDGGCFREGEKLPKAGGGACCLG